MKSALAPFLEFLEIGFFAVGAGALSTLGVYIENLALSAFSTGQIKVGFWLLWMGAAALYGGLYLLGYTELLPRVRGLRGIGADADAATESD